MNISNRATHTCFSYAQNDCTNHLHRTYWCTSLFNPTAFAGYSTCRCCGGACCSCWSCLRVLYGSCASLAALFWHKIWTFTVAFGFVAFKEYGKSLACFTLAGSVAGRPSRPLTATWPTLLIGRLLHDICICPEFGHEFVRNGTTLRFFVYDVQLGNACASAVCTSWGQPLAHKQWDVLFEDRSFKLGLAWYIHNKCPGFCCVVEVKIDANIILDFLFRSAALFALSHDNEFAVRHWTTFFTGVVFARPTGLNILCATPDLFPWSALIGKLFFMSTRDVKIDGLVCWCASIIEIKVNIASGRITPSLAHHTTQHNTTTTHTHTNWNTVIRSHTLLLPSETTIHEVNAMCVCVCVCV